MNKPDDGGSAFPEIFTDVKGAEGQYSQDTYSAGGMTLRDYFAAKAMMGWLASFTSDDTPSEGGIARFAYKMADEMLKERLR